MKTKNFNDFYNSVLSIPLKPVTITIKGRNFIYSGGFNINGKSFAIKEVIYSNPATIVFWDDNTKTVAKCYPEDTYNPETGLAVCILKKLIGGSDCKKLFEDWLPKEGNRVSLTDVRKKYK